MNETENKNPTTSAPESKNKTPAMETAATQNSQSELEKTQQSPLQLARPAEHDTRLSIELVKAESLVDGDLPEPSAHVISDHVPGAAQASRPQEPALEASKIPAALEKTEKGLRDQSGRYFNPAKHQHRSGIPKISPKGYFRPWGRIHLKAGLHLKPEGFASSDAEDEAEPHESFFDKAKRFVLGKRESEPVKRPESREPAPTAAQQSEHRQQFSNGGLIGAAETTQAPESGKSNEAATAAAQLVAMEEMIAVMVFSEEWQFLSEERKGLVMAWTRAFEEKGIVETPWWMELGAAHAVIFANRADKPKTREKLGKMKASIMKKVIDFRTAKAPANVEQRKEAQ